MKLKPEQIMTIIFTCFGIVMGFLSFFLGKGLFSKIIPLLLYAVSLFIFHKIYSNKKQKWIITNSIIPFILIWLITWVFIFNTL